MYAVCTYISTNVLCIWLTIHNYLNAHRLSGSISTRIGQLHHGTMYQLRNKLNRTNVVNTPKKDVNACEDFIETLTCGQVVTATISILQLKSANDHPSEAVLPGVANVWSLPSDERKKCLKTLCTSIYDKFIKFSYNSCIVVLQ